MVKLLENVTFLIKKKNTYLNHPKGGSEASGGCRFFKNQTHV